MEIKFSLCKAADLKEDLSEFKAAKKWVLNVVCGRINLEEEELPNFTKHYNTLLDTEFLIEYLLVEKEKAEKAKA
jgi:hypothetical protein